MTGAPAPLQAVRAATRPAHDRLDLPRLPSGPGPYRRLPAAVPAVRAARGGAGRRPLWGGLGVDPGERRKAPLIRRDLAGLGLPAAAVAAIPRMARLPRLDAPGRALGCNYVLAGATLGGRVACRLLGEAPLPRAFLSGYGPRTGAMWAAFRRALGVAPVPPADAAAGAAETFAAAEAWLSGRGPLARGCNAASSVPGWAAR